MAPPHIALFPCAGMGHLIPFLRLASMLSSRGCTVTLITAQPTISTAESNHLSTFFTNHPNIKQLEFQLIPLKKSNFINEDPFFRQFESINNSVYLMNPLFSSVSPPLSAIIADFVVASTILQLPSDLTIPIYILITTSAQFFSVMSYLPQLRSGADPEIIFSSIEIPVSSIPPPMLNPNHFFRENISSNISSLYKAKSILINTFNSFEPKAIDTLRQSPNLPPILPIGPVESFETGKLENILWLDEQEPESVLFVSFGSRTALSKDQIIELGFGLEKSGCKFLWVLKTNEVDKDDKDEVKDILGESFLERVKNKGMVIKGWVNQDRILAHRAIGGFVSHCGWNSVMEAAKLGVPILAWPQHGDQMVNAEVVQKAGLGLWNGNWGWGGEKLVDKDEISDKIIELMIDENLRSRVKEVKEKATQARGINGSSEGLFQDLIEKLRSKEKN